MSDPALTIAVPLIAEFEGFRSEPYMDAVGVATVGFGFTYIDGAPVTMATPPMSLEEGEARLAPLVATYLKAVREMVHVPITDNQAAALTSFSYNLGTQRLRTSHLMLDLNAGRYQEAADRFGEWVYAGGKMLAGLVKRRAAEKALFLAADGESAATAAITQPAVAAALSPGSKADDTADDLNQQELNRVTGA